MSLSAASASLQPVSVVVRSKNDGALIGATIWGIHRQDYPGTIEIIHIDSGSTDDTVEIIQESKPAKLIRIRADEYIPGAVLNRGMREASSPWVVFLNSDCEPANRHWMSELLASAQSDGGIGAAFGRQIPRRDCQAVYAHDYERCFGPARETARWDHFFSMASSVVRRAAWEEHPFREDLQYSEDDEWSRRLVARGWRIAYAEKAVVIHSHNYTLKQAFRRCYGEGFALAALDCVDERTHNLFRTVLAGVVRESFRDLRYCARTGLLAEWPHAIAVRTAQRLGKLEGFRRGWRHYRSANLHPHHHPAHV
jgi:rhamnosyltransferase